MENTILKKKGANFFGFERIDRDGKVHGEPMVIQGNGNLRLTNKGLYFSRWLPKMDLFIPIEKIKKVEIGNSHNGRWILFPMILKVVYEEDGQIKVFGVTVGWKKVALEWKRQMEEDMIID
ncbi:MAG: hypothetical protein AB1478_10310 [Nitrospirota bacterium]